MAGNLPRLFWLGLGSAGILVGLSTVLLTEWLRLDPCHLCIFQRLLMLAFGVLALGAAVLERSRRGRLALGALALCVAIAGVLVAAYQSWIQLQPAGSVTCVSNKPGLIEILVEWLGQQLPTLFLATGFCEDEGLRILGLTLANWSLACFAVVTILTAWALRRQV